MPSFTTELLQSGNTVGIQIPDAVAAELGGKRVAVVITLNGGDTVEVTIEVTMRCAESPDSRRVRGGIRKRRPRPTPPSADPNHRVRMLQCGRLWVDLS